ncbi:hypothetical protein OsI_17545 [Oryza sativa Indica Group]|uniref:3-beta hydroxysteroid dehydrogenase/isomerase domain-containing protein n=1 Tax=Oryza sativa subsp. indica TaxID=39946 RepID=B8AUU9_ORYSI|nr:hypothetical protein OsI_17545 [Oryza sativa Indica Group]
MSAVERKTACVTGGNGYIASALIKMLLQKGCAVNTTVRNPENMEKNSHFKDLHALGPLAVFRADLEEEGSFDEAVAGCDYAFLVAAPVNLKSENPQKELVEAGVRGTLNVMRSCVRAGTVRRVVLTSSAAAVSDRPLQGDGHVLDESSWSDVDYLSSPANKKGDQEMISTVKLMEKATGGLMLVHVDDLCRAEKPPPPPAAAAERYICCGLSATMLQLARFLAAKYPEYNVDVAALGDLSEKPRIRLSSEKLAGEGFEFKYRTLDEMYDDAFLEYGRALGILPY